MALTQGHFQAYDFNRMVVLFTMMDDEVEVPCAVSTDAMDRIEGSTRTTPNQREQQFLRLRDRIEERAARKFLDFEFEGNPPGIVLRSIDFRHPMRDRVPKRERYEHQDGGCLIYPKFKDVASTPVDLTDALCKN
jgi:hypothetical protein